MKVETSSFVKNLPMPFDQQEKVGWCGVVVRTFGRLLDHLSKSRGPGGHRVRFDESRGFHAGFNYSSTVPSN